MTDTVEALVRDNIDLAWWHANRAARRDDPMWTDDFESAALYALVKAARDFDPGYGKPFNAIATRYIRTELVDTRRRIHGSEHNSPRAPVGPLVDDVAARTEAGDDFEDFMAALPERDRRLLTLVFRDGLTRTEAGRALGMGKWKAMAAYDRALSQLRGRWRE